jgi:hypothetical protein
MYWFFDLEDYDWGPREPKEPKEPTIRDLPLERSDDQLWSPQSAALIEAFSAQKNELEVLREMMVVRGIRAVTLLGDNLLVDTIDGRQLEDQEVNDREQWLAKMERSNITGIQIVERFDMTIVFPQSPRTTPDRYETVNYLLNHPMPERECSDDFRHIPCGVCDVSMEDNWSIRFGWSSGEFESEYSDNFSKVYGNETSDLTEEEISSKVTKAREECREIGLKEMGYENPETVYSLGGNPALSDEAMDLVGEWPLCVDPDGRVNDSLLFESDGSGYVLRRDMPDIEFQYRVKGTSLRLLMQTDERAIWIPLKISPDGKKLLMYSDRTKNTSFYVRESDVAEYDCDSE